MVNQKLINNLLFFKRNKNGIIFTKESDFHHPSLDPNIFLNIYKNGVFEKTGY